MTKDPLDEFRLKERKTYSDINSATRRVQMIKPKLRQTNPRFNFRPYILVEIPERIFEPVNTK